jgi:hypothetical protein
MFEELNMKHISSLTSLTKPGDFICIAKRQKLQTQFFYQSFVIAYLFFFFLKLIRVDASRPFFQNQCFKLKFNDS